MPPATVPKKKGVINEEIQAWIEATRGRPATTPAARTADASVHLVAGHRLDHADPAMRGTHGAREPVMTNIVSSTRSNTNPLWLRIISALVLAPLPVAAIWFGWPWLPLLTGLAAAFNLIIENVSTTESGQLA